MRLQKSIFNISSFITLDLQSYEAAMFSPLKAWGVLSINMTIAAINLFKTRITAGVSGNKLDTYYQFLTRWCHISIHFCLLRKTLLCMIYHIGH